jgi:hypothetical protein
MASARIGRLASRRLSASANSAPSKTRTGRNAMRTTSGSRGEFGRTFAKTMSRPMTTSATLYGTPMRFAPTATAAPTPNTAT